MSSFRTCSGTHLRRHIVLRQLFRHHAVILGVGEAAQVPVDHVQPSRLPLAPHRPITPLGTSNRYRQSLVAWHDKISSAEHGVQWV